MKDLITYKKNVFSQNGEDGIIEELFRRIGTESSACCEFGAWDGIHLSNCRKLILSGWKALMIEGDPKKAKTLVQTYQNHPEVVCLNRYVDASENNLGMILKEAAFPPLDFLSVDIDGLDYEIFENLDVKPRVICIEVNAAFAPEDRPGDRFENAVKVSGQPLNTFIRIAGQKDYDLVCFTGNAFFVRKEICRDKGLKIYTAEEAYAEFIEHLQPSESEWLYLVNRGWVPPFHNYGNSYLDRRSLKIPLGRIPHLLMHAARVFCQCSKGYLQSKIQARQRRTFAHFISFT